MPATMRPYPEVRSEPMFAVALMGRRMLNWTGRDEALDRRSRD